MTTETRILNFHSTRSKFGTLLGKGKVKSTTGRKPYAKKQFPFSIDLPLDELPGFEQDTGQPTNIFSVVPRQSIATNQPTDSSLITTTINNVAVAYRTMGFYEEAKRLLEYGVQSFRRYNFSSRLLMQNLGVLSRK